MRDVRALRGDDVLAILKGTPRPLGRCVQVVMGNHVLAGHAAPGLGEGLLCALQEPRCIHVVSVFRCGDGHFLYYDPTPRPVYPAFEAFCRHNSIDAASVMVVRAAFQRPGFRTCAYHSLTFLDYVTRLDLQNSSLTIFAFKQYMGQATDLKAINTVRSLLQEFPNSVSLSTTLTPGANPVFVPPSVTSSSIRPPKARPAPPPPSRIVPIISIPSAPPTVARAAPPAPSGIPPQTSTPSVPITKARPAPPLS